MIVQNRFNLMPTVVKNLLIINGLFFLGMYSIQTTYGVDITRWLGLYFPLSENFLPHQLITHMFMHGNFGHIFSNMLMLWFLGSAMENYWGPKRFLIYYMLTGLGASALHIGVNAIEYMNMTSSYLSNEDINLILSGDIQAGNLFQGSKKIEDIWMIGEEYYKSRQPEDFQLINLFKTPMVGASGAVFGVLLAFGMTFPNQLIYLNFLFPIKAKYFVIGYGLFELYNGFMVSNSGIAHFAHLGGMLFGYILIRKWRRERYR
jgi:membrane associated rhomboid family serine protease